MQKLLEIDRIEEVLEACDKKTIESMREQAQRSEEDASEIAAQVAEYRKANSKATAASRRANVDAFRGKAFPKRLPQFNSSLTKAHFDPLPPPPGLPEPPRGLPWPVAHLLPRPASHPIHELEALWLRNQCQIVVGGCVGRVFGPDRRRVPVLAGLGEQRGRGEAIRRVDMGARRAVAHWHTCFS